jgi:hypothetical protein
VANVMSETNMKGRGFSHSLSYVFFTLPHLRFDTNAPSCVENGEKIENPEPEYEDDFLDIEEL